jgi:hypothetical protein
MRHPLGITLFLAFAALVIGLAWYGSPRAAFAAMRGQELLIDSRAKSAGSIRLGEKRTVVFRVKNLTGRSRRIVGGLSSCNCMMPKNLPMVIPPWGERALAIEVTPGEKAPFQRSILLYTTAESQHVIEVSISGQGL